MRMRRLRACDSSESGLISVSAVLAIGFLALIVYLLVAALDADTDHYGAIPVPSQGAPIELSKGETDVYLAERGDADELGDVEVPSNLTLAFTSARGGDVVRIDDRDSDTETTDDGVAKEIGALQVPEAGTYLVTASTGATGQISSGLWLTFGLSPLGAVEHKFEDVVDELNGPTGIVVLIALGALLLAPRVQRAFNR